MLQWKIDVMAALRDRGYTPSRIRAENLFGEATMTSLRYHRSVSWTALQRLCAILQAQPGDLLEYVQADGN